MITALFVIKLVEVRGGRGWGVVLVARNSFFIRCRPHLELPKPENFEDSKFFFLFKIFIQIVQAHQKYLGINLTKDMKDIC